MVSTVDALLCFSIGTSVLAFIVFYSFKSYRCNAEFNGRVW